MHKHTIASLAVAALAAFSAGCAGVSAERGCCCAVAQNTLTDAEKAAGWRLLWDGSTAEGWKGARSDAFPSHGWIMDGGVLTVVPRQGLDDAKWSEYGLPESRKGEKGGGGDIVTKEKFRDFEFKVDFRLTQGANSGIKYFFDETLNNGTTLEFQILHPGHRDWNFGRDGNRRIGALYDMLPAPKAIGAAKPAGEWNTAMLVSKGNHVEHWLNGVKVLEYERGGAQFMDAFGKSKYADPKTNLNGKWGLTPEGRILLQDHADSTVSFRNIKIRKL